MPVTSMQRILVSGASGLIGLALIRALGAHRIETLQLVRGRPGHPGQISWHPGSPQPFSDPQARQALDAGFDAAIHLSGANLASRRWTAAYKKEIRDSRIATTRALVDILKGLRQPPRTLLCASATGIYGDRGDEILTEDSPSGQGFLANVCRAWESEAARAGGTDASHTDDPGIRVVHLRFGVVLGPDGGALARMLPLFRLGLGGRLGSGRQWMSWIALPDLVRAILFLLEPDFSLDPDSPSRSGPMNLSGPVNLVAPNPVTNADFTRTLAHSLHRPAILPAPAFALRAAFGEMADAALLSSTRVLPDRLLRAGFRFELPTIEAALKSLL